LTEFWARESTADVAEFMIGQRVRLRPFLTGGSYTPWIDDIQRLLGAAGFEGAQLREFMGRMKFLTEPDVRGLEIAKAIGRRRGWNPDTIRGFEHAMALQNASIVTAEPRFYRPLSNLLDSPDFKLPGAVYTKQLSRFEKLQNRVLGLLLTTTPDTAEEDEDLARDLIGTARSDAERIDLEGALEGFSRVRFLREVGPGGPVRVEDLPGEPLEEGE
ncbi:MAG: hypothetical protein ACE5IM_12430, partial [Nitrospinota bacterium]